MAATQNSNKLDFRLPL